jgi:hypothetical protein
MVVSLTEVWLVSSDVLSLALGRSRQGTCFDFDFDFDFVHFRLIYFPSFPSCWFVSSFRYVVLLSVRGVTPDGGWCDDRMRRTRSMERTGVRVSACLRACRVMAVGLAACWRIRRRCHIFRKENLAALVDTPTEPATLRNRLPRMAITRRNIYIPRTIAASRMSTISTIRHRLECTLGYSERIESSLAGGAGYPRR